MLVLNSFVHLFQFIYKNSYYKQLTNNYLLIMFQYSLDILLIDCSRSKSYL